MIGRPEGRRAGAAGVALPRLRLTVFVRLLLTLAGVAALPTLVLMAVQERALARDLEGAATARLERSRHAAERLLDAHLAGLAERYRAVSGTPQFRATLELGDAATLRFYAAELARREGAAAVAFVSADGEITAGGEAPELADLAMASALDGVFVRGDDPRWRAWRCAPATPRSALCSGSKGSARSCWRSGPTPAARGSRSSARRAARWSG